MPTIFLFHCYWENKESYTYFSKDIIVNLSIIIDEIIGHVHKREYKKINQIWMGYKLLQCLDGEISNLRNFDGYTEN
jgi:hypothetical protein